MSKEFSVIATTLNLVFAPNVIHQKIIWPCFDFVDYSLQENKCRFAKQPDVHLKPVSWWMVHFPETQGTGILLVTLSLLALAVQA